MFRLYSTAKGGGGGGLIYIQRYQSQITSEYNIFGLIADIKSIIFKILNKLASCDWLQIVKTQTQPSA